MRKHNPALDGVRGLAILMVLLWHCFYLNPDNAVVLVWNRLAGLGWLGVDLFFVLSGYLITTILLAERGQPGYYARFYLRRTLRIFPAYYLVLATVLLLIPLFNSHLANSNVSGQWLYFVTYLQNWGEVKDISQYNWPGIHHFWSLAIEEQFYLVWPLLVASIPPERFRKVCILLIISSIAVKGVLLVSHASWVSMYVSTIGRLEGLAGGALIASLTPDMVNRVKPWARLAGCVGVLGLIVMLAWGAPLMSRITLVWAIPCATALFGWLIFSIHQKSLSPAVERTLSSGWLRWLGRYSYGIYLWHYVVYWCIKPSLLDILSNAGFGDATSNQVILTLGAITLVVTLALSVLMYAFVEAPLLRSRGKLQSFFARQAQDIPSEKVPKPS